MTLTLINNDLGKIFSNLSSKNLNIDLPSTDFLQIQKPIQSGEYCKLGEISSDWLNEGYYDFRLIIYYLNSKLLSNESIIEILSVVSNILETQYEQLGPKKHKQKQISQTIYWFHKRILVCIENENLQAQKYDEHFELVLKNYKNNIKEICNISFCENFDLVEKKLKSLIEIKQEISDANKNTTPSKVNVNKLKEEKSYKKNNNTVFYSDKLEKLLNKIEAFEFNINKKDYKTAASIEYIIDEELEKYKIDYYFEDLFFQYYNLKFNFHDKLFDYREKIVNNQENKQLAILKKILNNPKYFHDM